MLNIKRDWMNSPLKFFLALMPMQIWRFITDVVNENLLKLQNQHNVGSGRRYMNFVTPLDMLHFYGVVMCLENTYSSAKNCIRKNYQEIRNAPFGVKRYESILRALTPTNSQIQFMCKMMSEAFQMFVIPGSSVANDETIWEYQPDRHTKDYYEYALGDSIPVVFIPGKPHPNGFQCWKFAVRLPLTGKPYVIDFEMFLNNNDSITPTQATVRMLQRWPYRHQPHLTLDARYSSLDFMRELSDMGVYATMGMSVNQSPYIWDLLKRDCKMNNWNGFISQSGYLISVKLQSDDKRTNQIHYHHLLTNAFSAERFHAPSANTSEASQITNVETTLTYSLSYLNNKNCNELAEILKSHGLTIGRRKKDIMIGKIMECCNKASSEMVDLLTQIDSQSFGTVPIHHDYYRRTFNSVDLHDKQWYRFHYRYGLRQWRAKMCLCIWMEAVTNARSLVNEFVKMPHVDIREAIAQGLLNLKEQDIQ